jgi:hypothetical protein
MILFRTKLPVEYQYRGGVDDVPIPSMVPSSFEKSFRKSTFAIIVLQECRGSLSLYTLFAVS